MKNIAAVLIAIVVTSFVWLVAVEEVKFNKLKDTEKRVWLPTMVIIRDLNSTLAAGEYESLRIKLNLFQKRWSDYFPDGDPPIIFRDEILAVGAGTHTGKGAKTDSSMEEK